MGQLLLLSALSSVLWQSYYIISNIKSEVFFSSTLLRPLVHSSSCCVATPWIAQHSQACSVTSFLPQTSYSINDVSKCKSKWGQRNRVPLLCLKQIAIPARKNDWRLNKLCSTRTHQMRQKVTRWKELQILAISATKSAIARITIYG